MKKQLEKVKMEVLFQISKITTAITLFMFSANTALAANAGTTANVGKSSTTAEALSDEAVNNTLKRATVWGQGILVTLVGLCLLIFVAYPLITGGDEGNQKAKKGAKGIAIGFLIGEFALNIGLTAYNFIKG